MKLVLLSSISALTLLLGATYSSSTFQQQEPSQDNTRPFMRAKLVGSQSVLDGLVTEDFGLIHRGAENMKKLSEALQWPRAEDKIYTHFGTEFRRQCDKLMELAEKKNLEGAQYTYLSMTTTCISCHNYVRSAFRIERDKDNPQGPVRLIPTDWEGRTHSSDRSAVIPAKRLRK